MENCIFCKIIKGGVEASKIYEDDICAVFLDIQPVNPGHVLIIPKVHKEFIHELEDDAAARLFIIANKVNRALRRSDLKCEGINYFLADGEAAFQEVGHTHLHCFPRYKDDGFGLKFSKRYFDEKPDRDELNNIARNIKENMA